MSRILFDLKKAPGKARKKLFEFLFPDVKKFINDIYAMPRDPSYFIRPPQQPANIKELLEP